MTNNHLPFYSSPYPHPLTVLPTNNRVALRIDKNRRQSIPNNVAVVYSAAPLVVHIDADLFAVVDAAAADRRIGTGLDLDAGEGVAVDVAVLDGAAPLLLHPDAALFAVVDAAAADDRVCA